MPKHILPRNAELLKLLHAAYRLYSDELWHATPSQRAAWQHINLSKFVEGAGPMKPETHTVLALALKRIVEEGLKNEAALKYAKRREALQRRRQSFL
ncbi:hypothetical protein [Bradyrhizobium australiense]|uniref:Uncharacterized protein n=1 Tax=Bradyrhizobium australiense TaxID=2721161 RepID=A0A7Y4LVG2_9BRAD|nr:hypothetical protein [Bradyrhizobium australiense]NOJ40004.1 hypothetical protein [Bradyrhizobium australiense]